MTTPLFRLRLALCSIALLLAASPSTAATSQLWGAQGERWKPGSRLPDFSFAGYRRGEEPYRIPGKTVSVQEFGARGDGRTDDTAAFKQAINAGTGRVITLPPGRFVLSDVLEIHTSRLVLRGAGRDRTTLLFQKPLEVLRPSAAKTDHGEPTSQWSWGGGLIMIGSRETAPSAAVRVTSPAIRGDQALTVDHTTFKQGDEIVLYVYDTPGKSLVKYLYRGAAGDFSGLNKWKCSQVFRVVQADGKRLMLDRPLRFDVRLEWKPAVSMYEPRVTDVGIEGVGFEFPNEAYQGHFKEVGFNPVVIQSGAAHCWLRDLRVWNGDSGPYVNGRFCTVENIYLGADPGRKSAQGHTGHHGITLQGSDSLCTNFVVDTRFIHDVTVQSAIGCVYCSGRALDLNLDHHRWAPYENLFTDLDAGLGARLFSSSGGGNRGLHAAAGGTYWNIRTQRPVPYPKNFGPNEINIVGINMACEEELTPQGRWVEKISGVQPPNLYSAMLKKRLTAAEPK